jgi:hypothetical protein
MKKGKEKQFFFEKKNQKTFVNLPPGDVARCRVKVTKVFCGTGVAVPPFFQKSDRLLSLAFS